MSEVNDNTYSIMNNPLLQDSTIAQTAANVIQDSLETLPSYVPTEVNTFFDWSYDAGDIVTLAKDGVDYLMPIFTNYLSWNGAHDITWANSGNEERELPDVTERRSYGTGSAIAAAETEISENLYEFHTYVDQTDTYIHLIATETEVATAQTVGQSLFSITSSEIGSVVAQTGVTSSLEEFDTDKAYAIGDQVQYGGVWYEFTSAHTAGDDWDATEVEQVTNQETRITQNTNGITSLVTKTGVNSLGQNETLYSMITQNADKISLVVTESGKNNVVNTASIILAINGGTGHSDAYIEADTIILNGSSIVATGEFGAPAIVAPEMDCTNFYQSGYGGQFGVNAEAYFYGNVHMEGSQVIFGDDGVGLLTGPSLEVGTAQAGSLTLVSGNNSETLDYSALGSMVKSFSVNGNVLTLNRFNGTSENFSKATVLTPGWGSGANSNVFTVTASQNGVDIGSESTTVTVEDSGVWYNGSIPIYARADGGIRATGSVSIPSTVSFSGSETSLGTFSITCSIGGTTRTGTCNINASYSYDDGYYDGWVEAMGYVYLDPNTDQTISSATTVKLMGKATPNASTSIIDSVKLTPSGGGGGGTVLCQVPIGEQRSCGYSINDYEYEWMPVSYGGYNGYMMSKYVRSNTGTADSGGTRAYKKDNGYSYSGDVEPGVKGTPSGYYYTGRAFARSGSTVNLRSSPSS